MSPRYDKEWIAGLLDSDKRLGPLSPEEFLRQSGLMDGMSVVDYGCGPGLFTMAAANVVGAQGLVYALDIEPKMVALVASRAAEAGLDNVKAALNKDIVAQLPDAVADFGICALVLHYYDRRAERLSVARELGRLVKSGGQVLVVQRTPSRANAPSQLVSVDETTSILVEAGFELDGAYGEATGQFYTLVASKLGA